MNLFRFRQFLALGACGLLATLGGCDKATTAGGSDEIDTRLAVDRTGRPVAGARISLVKAGDSTGTALAISATGSDGSFPNFVVPDGFYSVLLRDPGDTLGRFVDSVHVVSRKLPSGRDTLLSLGSVRGVVRLGSGDSPTSVTVGLLGTDILANVRADGSFKIELVPGGLYTLGAATSLDGYGRLYKRIQLKDGQDLVLADTLVLPFTGLPIPAGLRVLQDTATGNVQVAWSRVAHPDLMGYVLERVEGGTTTFSRYLTDTSWTDSLGAYWEAMPLYGPWPSRDVAYRVRSRSLSGAMDTKSTALAITAKPPEWTKRIDTVSLVEEYDSLNRVTTLRWNPLKHPSLIAWSVERVRNGKPDCKDSIQGSTWTDDVCKKISVSVLDSIIPGDGGSVLKLYDNRAMDIQYFVRSVRAVKNVSGEIQLNFVRKETSDFVTWRDSIALVGSRLNRVGGWLLLETEGARPRISRDGLDWEILPIWRLKNSSVNQTINDTSWWICGSGDSLWLISNDFGVEYPFYRAHISKNKWEIHTLRWGSQPFRSSQVFAFDNAIVVAGIKDSFDGNLYNKRVFGDSLVDYVMPILGGSFYANWIYMQYLDSLNWQGKFSSGTYRMKNGVLTKWEDVAWVSGRRSNCSVDVYGFDGMICTSTVDGAERLGYFEPKGNGYLLNAPCDSLGVCGSLNGLISIGNELVTISNGHLWKGKLNLPK